MRETYSGRILQDLYSTCGILWLSWLSLLSRGTSTLRPAPSLLRHCLTRLSCGQPEHSLLRRISELETYNRHCSASFHAPTVQDAPLSCDADRFQPGKSIVLKRLGFCACSMPRKNCFAGTWHFDGGISESIVILSSSKFRDGADLGGQLRVEAI